MRNIKTVFIPKCQEHNGLYGISINLLWVCPKCGGKRGDVYKTESYDGSKVLNCDGWENPCGHIDTYDECREESINNGLNINNAKVRKNSKHEIIEKMIKIYDEFGIDVHSIPSDLQSQINYLVKEIIKLRDHIRKIKK